MKFDFGSRSTQVADATLLRTIHLIVGSAGFAVFLLTGQYMQWVHHGLQEMPDGPRLFFRSAHIYLLWSSLLNLLVGCYLVRLTASWARHLQFVACLAILLGPVLLSVSFVIEQYNPGLLRPIGQWAIFLSAVGVVAHVGVVIAARPSGKAGRVVPSQAGRTTGDPNVMELPEPKRR